MNAANTITLLRIPFALAMLFSQPFSMLFWVCYLCAGLSDILDGVVARKLKQQSELGARLDSMADLIFACAVAVVMVTSFSIPAWLIITCASVALLRAVGYGVGYMKYRAFSALHTYANKAAGGTIFLFPLLYRLLGVELSGILSCVVAFASALEELLITIRSDTLNRDRKSLFLR